MKGNKIFALVVFLGVASVCFIAIYFLNVLSNNRFERDKSLLKANAVLESMGMLSEVDKRDDVYKFFNENISEVEDNGLKTYTNSNIDDNSNKIALDVSASGIFGPIRGVLTTDAKKEKLLGLSFYQRSNFPGYGKGLFFSQQWLDRAYGYQLLLGSASGNSESVDGTSGASRPIKTIKRLNELFGESLLTLVSGGIELFPLDLNIGVDAVTKATPGYPKGLVKPDHLRAEVKRPTFLTTKGVELISIGKKVTCSMDYEPIIGELQQLTDGIKTCTEFDFVELDFGTQWVQIDLGEEFQIHAVVVWHFYKNPIIYNDVIVQTSNDESFKKNVTTIYNNDDDNSSRLGAGQDSAYFARWWGEIADARGNAYTGTPGRYVRVYTNGGSSGEDTRFVEIEVYSKKSEN